MMGTVGVKLTYIGRDPSYHLALGRAHVRIPDIQDQHGTRLIAVVPGFVFESIVENEGLTGMPLAALRADPKSAAGRDDQWEMYDEPRIRNAGVRGNAGLGVEN